MATSVYTDFKVYQEEFFGGFTEVLQQNANAFNTASRNAIRLVPRRLKGHYEKESFFDVISGLVSRRDTTSVSAATAAKLTQDEFIGVKLNRKIGPVEATLDSFRKIAMDPQEMSFILGQQWAQGVAEDYLNSALRALEGALDAQTALEHGATDGTIATSDLVSGLAKFGDAAGRIVCWVMHSKVYYDLVASQIAANIDGISNFNVAQAMPVTLNRPVIVTDSAALVEADGVSSGVDAYSTLGLVASAAVLDESEERQIVSDLVTGNENLIMRLQGEYAFNLKLKGLQWDTTNGGINPADAALATGSNWDKAVASDKLLPGVIIKSQ